MVYGPSPTIPNETKSPTKAQQTPSFLGFVGPPPTTRCQRDSRSLGNCGTADDRGRGGGRTSDFLRRRRPDGIAPGGVGPLATMTRSGGPAASVDPTPLYLELARMGRGGGPARQAGPASGRWRGPLAWARAGCELEPLGSTRMVASWQRGAPRVCSPPKRWARAPRLAAGGATTSCFSLRAGRRLSACLCRRSPAALVCGPGDGGFPSPSVTDTATASVRPHGVAPKRCLVPRRARGCVDRRCTLQPTGGAPIKRTEWRTGAARAPRVSALGCVRSDGGVKRVAVTRRFSNGWRNGQLLGSLLWPR